jgi:hypothetical protein
VAPCLNEQKWGDGRMLFNNTTLYLNGSILRNAMSRLISRQLKNLETQDSGSKFMTAGWEIIKIEDGESKNWLRKADTGVIQIGDDSIPIMGVNTFEYDFSDINIFNVKTKKVRRVATFRKGDSFYQRNLIF